MPKDPSQYRLVELGFSAEEVRDLREKVQELPGREQLAIIYEVLRARAAELSMEAMAEGLVAAAEENNEILERQMTELNAKLDAFEAGQG